MNKRDVMAQIRAHATDQALTIRQLCALAGVDYVTWYRWDTTRTKPREATAAKLLGVQQGRAVPK